MDPYEARAIIEPVAIEKVSPSEVEVSGNEGEAAVKQSARIGGRFSLAQYGTAIGSILSFAPDRSSTALIIDETRVDFEGKKMSLSEAALTANRKSAIVKQAVAP